MGLGQLWTRLRENLKKKQKKQHKSHDLVTWLTIPPFIFVFSLISHRNRRAPRTAMKQPFNWQLSGCTTGFRIVWRRSWSCGPPTAPCASIPSISADRCPCVKNAELPRTSNALLTCPTRAVFRSVWPNISDPSSVRKRKADRLPLPEGPRKVNLRAKPFLLPWKVGSKFHDLEKPAGIANS